ncbi:DUF748 domain-containing protein [Pseudomonas aeruginosa]|uniref:DUF748 domain-containing protein n=1 Tax=Pseudomonas aeruginosa TaxID=287 RepID=UPI000F837174|nr:DUF748 domain-containing protein [Pseudomonas aeruginosa]RTS58201.1 DUF748 domain-containing protein [Pseudomonas aeruginosa]
MPKGLKRAVSALLITFLVYCLLGFLLIPGIGLRVANQQLAQYATVPARLERIEFNPFSLELTLWGLRLGEEKNPQLAFRRLYANLQLDSLWKRQLHLADVELEGPHTELLFDEKGQLNLASLFRIPPSESPEPEQPSDPFPLRIDRIQLAEGSLHFQDLRPSEPVDFSFDPLGFELHNLSTLPDDGAKMTLLATGPNGGRLDWEGDLTLVPITSRGHLSVKDIQLKAWWPYVRDNAPLVLENGVVSLSSDYRLDLSKDTQLLLDKAALKLADFSINSPQGKPLAKLASLDVAATTLDLTKQEVVLGEVRSQGLEAWAAREKDGQLDWQKLFADFTPPPRKAPAPKPAENTDPAAAPTDAAKTTREPATDGAAKAAAIASGEASKDRPAEKNASVAETERATDDKESAKVAEGGAADKVAKQETSEAPKTGKATGQETAKTAEIDKAASDSPQQLADTAKTPPPESTKAAAETPAKPWHIVLRDAQLRGYKAHLVDRQPATEVPLEVGPLDLDLQNVDSLGKTPFDLKLKTGLGNRGQVQASGQVVLDPVSARLKVSTRDIDLRVAQAYISPFIRLELRSGFLGSELAVDLKSVEPLAFSVDGSAEVSQLHTLDTIKDRDFVKWTKLTLNGLAYRHEDSLSIQSVSFEEPYARFIINEDRSTNVSELIIPQPASSSGKAAAESKNAPASKPLGIHIGGVRINNGSANFADLTLMPPFGTAIQQLSGEVGTLDTRNSQPAKVDIKGKVDKYAPVTIAGELDPFDPLKKLDITTSFKRVELTTLTPYSGKFAGYRIRKGRLNLDLHYQIERSQLKAENKVLLEGLQLGEKVDSPDAVDLPVKLAVALLKDTKGNIDIQLPVAGDLNNPEFSVMPIVWQTLRNLVLRAVQAPFKFIAGLAAGGNEDLGTVPFAAGSDELTPEAQANLDKLADALKERPALRLEVEGVASAAADGPSIGAKRLELEYQNTYYRMLQRRGDKVPSDAKQLEVPENMQAPLLEGIYRTRLKQQPPAEWKELDSDERTAKMREAVIASWAKSQVLLRQIGQARATRIKDYLVEKGQLPDDRIYLIDVSFAEGEDKGNVDTQLHLDSE